MSNSIHPKTCPKCGGAIHRMRKRFRELVKQEISRTLPNPSDVDDELRHLIAALT